MIVKIGENKYSSMKEPIMIIFEEYEKELIINMGSQKIFTSFPQGMTLEEISTFMKDEKTNIGIVTRRCVKCKQDFSTSIEEINWLKKHNLSEYRRCPECRKELKMLKETLKK